jgi:20S proteasome alpha/beta subunit
VRGKKGVLLAGDSQFSSLFTNRKIASAKTFQLSDVLAVAYCGYARLGQLLEYHMIELEDPPLGRDEQKWAVKEFIPHLRDIAFANGHMHVHHNVEHLGPSAFFLAVRGRLFTVDDDLSVTAHQFVYDALGSGEDVAIGAMHALAGEAVDPLPESKLESIAFAGVTAATEFTNHVGGDINTVHTALFTTDELKFAREMLGQ